MTSIRSSRRNHGFTLLEVLTVVAIVAILAGIALPSYLDYVRRGYIQEATTALADGRVKLEQFFQDYRTYVAGPCPGNTKYFALTCPTLTATQFTIQAAGTDAMSSFTYTINQDAARASTTPWTSGTQSCWITRKGDTC